VKVELNVQRQAKIRNELGVGNRVVLLPVRQSPMLATSPSGQGENLSTLVSTLRRSEGLTRLALSKRSGLSTPTVHRLTSVLLEMGLVIENEAARSRGKLGRPSNLFRIDSLFASVAGIDVGSETTRIAVASADGTILAACSFPTMEVAADLPSGLASELNRMLTSLGPAAGPLVGAGVGIAGSVNPETGVVTRAFLQDHWVGQPMREQLKSELGCPVILEQDDHLSVFAEVSAGGTVPGATSLVEINYGRGICAGVVTNGEVIKGVRGWAGRIMYWPADGLPGATLREQLPPDAMIRAYQRAGGMSTEELDGESICRLARLGDKIAAEVVDRVATTLGGVFLRLATIVDPPYMILGGGFAASFDLFESEIRKALAVLPNPPQVMATAIGRSAVTLGALLAGDQFVDNWLASRVSGVHEDDGNVRFLEPGSLSES
jgi:predicted NBD/HSP70 family sugar kinase